MPVTIIMPKLDKIMDRATLVQWYKEDGQSVNEGEPIALIETDKLTVELESPASGTLMRSCAQGSVAEVGEVVGHIYQVGETPQTASTVKTMPKTVTAEESPKSTTPTRQVEEFGIRATPVAKRIAKELGIRLETIKGTGEGGVITREDVLALKPLDAAVVEEEIIPLLGWRQTMADRMSRSKHTAAHITTVAEVDVTELVKLKEEVSPLLQTKYDARITYTSFIVKAVVTALQEYPIVNSSLINDKIVVKKYCNIGVAVAREDKGLIVPVIRGAEKMDLVETSRRVNELTEKARGDSLSLEDLREGTFTITNVGMFGVILNTPIINQPQSAILGVGAIKKRPVVINDQITVRSMMYLSLSYDHRVVDGLPAIRFLQKVRELLESPRNLLPAN